MIVVVAFKPLLFRVTCGGNLLIEHRPSFLDAVRRNRLVIATAWRVAEQFVTYQAALLSGTEGTVTEASQGRVAVVALDSFSVVAMVRPVAAMIGTVKLLLLQLLLLSSFLFHQLLLHELLLEACSAHLDHQPLIGPIKNVCKCLYVCVCGCVCVYVRLVYLNLSKNCSLKGDCQILKSCAVGSR